MTTPGLDRSSPPSPGTARTFSFPRILDHRLTSGVRVLAVPAPEVPIVDVQLLLPAGGDRAPAGSPGLPALAAGLLDEGTTGKDSQAIAAITERLGGYLGSGADWDVASIEAEVLAEDFEVALGLIAEIGTRPAFAEREFERLRRQFTTEIQRQRSLPAVLASEALMATLYRGTVYAEPLLGSPESLAALDRDGVRSFYSRTALRRPPILVVSGAVAPGEVFELAERFFAEGPWDSAVPEDGPELPIRPLDGRQVVVVDRPGAPQTEIRVGLVGVPRNHPDYPAVVLASTLLGGKFTSRLNLNLRERHGFTYGVRSRWTKRRGPGPFTISTAVDNDNVGAAVREILAEVELLVREPPTEVELRESQDYLIGSFPYSVETVRSIGSRLRELAVHELPLDTYANWAQSLRNLEPDRIHQVVRALIDPERLCVACAGPADLIADSLEGAAGAGPPRILAADTPPGDTP